MATTKQASIAIKIDGANAAKQDVDGIRSAFEKLGDTGKVAATPIINAFQNIENASEKVTSKISAGRVVTERDGKVILQQFIAVKDQLEKTFGSIANAPIEVQQAFAKAENQLKSTTTKIQQMTEAVNKNKDQFKEGGVVWDGFAGTLNKMIGPAGAVQMQMLAVAAALRAGWEAGQKINDVIGTNKTALESSVTTWKEAAKSVTDALTKDGPIAAIQQYAVAATAWIKSLGETGQAIKAQGVLLEAGVPQVQAYTLAAKDSTTILELHTLAAKGGAAGLKAWADAVAEAAKDPANFAKYLDSQKERFLILAKAHKEAAERAADYKAAIDKIISGYTDEIKKLEELKISRDLGLKYVEAETVAANALLTAQMAARDGYKALLVAHQALPPAFTPVIEKLAELTQHYGGNEAAVAAYTEALKTDYNINKSEIDPARQQQITRLAAMLGKYGELDTAGKAQVQSDLAQLNAGQQLGVSIGETTKKMVDGKTVITNVIKETGDLTIKQDALTETYSNLGAKTSETALKFDGHKKSIVSVGSATLDLVEKIGDLDSAIAANISGQIAWEQQMRNTTSAARDLNQAVSDLAGKQGATSAAPLPPQSTPAPGDFTPSGPDITA